MYNEKYLKTKIKSKDGRINTNFHENGIPNTLCFLSVILMYSVLKMGKNHYLIWVKTIPQVLMEEWKYVVKENKMTKFINDEIYSNESDEEISNEE